MRDPERSRQSSQLWDANLCQHLQPLTVLPSQGVSINGMCLDYVGGTPAQICALESGTLKAIALEDGSEVECICLVLALHVV